jgi:Uma2 family endonuclease
MSSAEIPAMSLDEFLSLPEDGWDREYIRGELRTKPMTYRNRHHSRATITIGTILNNWAISTRGAWEVYGGEAGFILSREPRTIVGIDIAVVSRELMSMQTDETTVLEGAPTVAIEILSPSDTVEDMHEKTELYLDHGVAVVWWLDPQDRTVRIYRQNQLPVMLNESQELTGEPELPGLRVAVSDLFE